MAIYFFAISHIFFVLPITLFEGKERRDMVLQEVRKGVEDQRRSKSVQLGQQEAWTKWDLPSRKVTWAELWRLEPIRISLMLRSVYDTLP